MRIRDLLRPELTELNRLPARPPLVPFPDTEAARAGGTSPWRRSLDGRWRFQLVDRPDAAPDAWMDPEHDDAGWDTITVPSCWTREGVGDLPHYTNITMPWDLEPPAVPAADPTGLYRTRFDLPDDPTDRDVVVHLGGAESMAVVWCNGHFVGMGKDSRLPSEFDLSPYVTAGENLLAVMVVRYTDATWIEDQDHWWHAGLHRSVHLEARGHTRLDDLVVVADRDPDDGRGALTVTARISGDNEGTAVRVTVDDPDGAVLASATAAVASRSRGSRLEQLIDCYVNPGPVATVELEAGPVRAWTAETPVRYRVITELLDADGATVEAHATWTGFRRIEIRDRRLLVNGRPVVLHGVNRHDHHHDTGKTLTVDELREDLVSMKRHNIDAVRTAHYPNDHRLLDLCDELGLYVVAEANVESHGRLLSLSQDERWAPAILDRTRRLVRRDRNHPCVIGWSLGNEAGAGPVFDAAAAWVRRVDPTRFVQYEGVVGPRFDARSGRSEEAPTPSERLVTDVVCPMYAGIDTVVSWARWAERTERDDRPLILCEFSHAMGNSNGSLAEYVDAFHAEPALGGGFVWDWRDQGLAETDIDDRFYWAYGGHFGDEPNDANFCINGLVGPDGRPHPGLREYQWACRPVTAEHLDGKRVRFHNRRVFASTADLTLHWTLHVDGRSREHGQLEVHVNPGTNRVVNLPVTERIRPGHECHFTLVWTLTDATSWAPAGHIVAWDQVDVTRAAPDPVRLPPGLTDERCRVDIDDTGIEGVWFDGRQVVMSDIVGWLWRAPTDNDGVGQGWMADRDNARTRWMRWGLDRLAPMVDEVRIRDGAEGRTIEVARRMAGPEAEATRRTTIFVTDAGIRFDEELVVPDVWADVARVGVRFDVRSDLERLQWMGPGPDETYPDRCGAAMVARWESTVTDQYHPFVVPQDHGVHVDTRWFALVDASGRGVRVDADPRFVFAARHHHDQHLDDARTLAELMPGETIEVHIDAAVRGLGTAACGPDVRPPYLVAPGTHRFSYTMRPIGPAAATPS